MPTLNAIALALELAAQKRDAAATYVVQVQRSVRAAQEQLAQLQGYATQTNARWIASAKTVSVELLRHHYQFMQRLQQVIALQKNVVQQLQLQFEAAQHKLQQKEVDFSKLKHVVQAKQKQQQLEQARQEQRQTDEFASMAHTRKKLQALREQAQ